MKKTIILVSAALAMAAFVPVHGPEVFDIRRIEFSDIFVKT